MTYFACREAKASENLLLRNKSRAAIHSRSATLRSDVDDLPEEITNSEMINPAHLFSFYQCIIAAFELLFHNSRFIPLHNLLFYL